MKKFTRFIKRLFFTFVIALCIAFSIYTAAWFAYTKRAETYIQHLIDIKEITLTGETPHFTNFPHPPELAFSGTITHNKSGLTISSPLIVYTGFPVASQRQIIEAPEGMDISANFLDKDIHIDKGVLDITLPKSFPTIINRENLENWQKKDSPLLINHIEFSTLNLSATGSGTLTLDKDLQLNANINTRVAGFDSVLDNLEKEQGQKTIAMARSFYNMLAQTDATTGTRYFETTLKIQNKSLYFGPMLISRLPALDW